MRACASKSQTNSDFVSDRYGSRMIHQLLTVEARLRPNSIVPRNRPSVVWLAVSLVLAQCGRTCGRHSSDVLGAFVSFESVPRLRQLQCNIQHLGFTTKVSVGVYVW